LAPEHAPSTSANIELAIKDARAADAMERELCGERARLRGEESRKRIRRAG